MKRYIYRLLADYYYIKASKYEHTLRVFKGQVDWMSYISNTGSIVMRKESCLKKAKYYMSKTT